MRNRLLVRAAVASAAAVLIAPIAAAMPAQGAAAPAVSSRAPASAQVVLDWERIALRTVYTENLTPIPVGVLYLGFTSVAMDRAAYRARRHGGSSAAAVAVAAHHVLLKYFEASRAALDADLATSLAAIPPGPKKAKGKAAGAKAAARMIRSRVGDGRDDTSIVYSRAEKPGIWQPAEGTTFLAPWLGFVDPLLSDRRPRVNGPDPLGSWAYAQDYMEVKQKGSLTGSDRTPFETETASFFNTNPPAMYGAALLERLSAHPMSLRKTTHLFAAMHGAMTDAVISCWRLKYRSGFWRPFQAIHQAGTDGNPATVPDTEWTAFLTNPPYPDYASGHGCVTSSAMGVLRRVLGEQTSLTLNSPVTGTSRSYTNLTELEHEAFHARIWGGIHFRDAMDDAYKLGHKAARYALRALG
jgi:hypothetical protein